MPAQSSDGEALPTPDIGETMELDYARQAATEVLRILRQDLCLMARYLKSCVFRILEILRWPFYICLFLYLAVSLPTSYLYLGFAVATSNAYLEFKGTVCSFPVVRLTPFCDPVDYQKPPTPPRQIALNEEDISYLRHAATTSLSLSSRMVQDGSLLRDLNSRVLSSHLGRKEPLANRLAVLIELTQATADHLSVQNVKVDRCIDSATSANEFASEELQRLFEKQYTSPSLLDRIIAALDPFSALYVTEDPQESARKVLVSMAGEIARETNKVSAYTRVILHDLHGIKRVLDEMREEAGKQKESLPVTNIFSEVWMWLGKTEGGVILEENQRLLHDLLTSYLLATQTMQDIEMVLVRLRAQMAEFAETYERPGEKMSPYLKKAASDLSKAIQGLKRVPELSREEVFGPSRVFEGVVKSY